MNRIARILLPALAALALPATLAAQPFRSDVQGPLPTGSGVAGYPVVPVRDLEGALFRQVDGRTAFRSRGVADPVLAEAAAAHQELCSGTLRRPRDWDDAVPFQVDAQRLVCALLGRPDDDSLERLACLLGGGGPGDGVQDPAEQLVAALSGLGYGEIAFMDARQRFVGGARWEEAFRLYEAYLDWAPDAVMAQPPPELRVIAAVLDRVVDAGLRAADR